MKKALFHIILFSLVLSFCSGCFNFNEKTDSESANAKYDEALQNALDETAAKYNAPGAVLLVRFTDNTIWTGTTGYSQLTDDGGLAMKAKHHFRIGSVTKTFVGTAILLLVQNGELSLDDSVEKLQPGLIPDGEKIDVRMLLNHTSGLYDFTHDEHYLEIYADQPDRVWTPEALVAIAVANGPDFEPGEKGVYSNTNYVILGMIIETVSGQKIEDFFQDEIFTPLELKNTSFPTEPEMPETYTHGYLDLNADGIFTPDEDFSYQSTTAIWAAGAIVSTPENLLSWLDALVDGRLLDDDIQAERLDFSIPIDGYPEGFFGLGIGKMDGGVGHTGAVIGYTTIALRYKGVDFIAYCNGYMLTEDAVSIASEIYMAAVKAVFGDTVTI